MPFIIYADFECFRENIDRCKSNPENSCTTNVGKHIPSGLDDKDCMKKFCESLREQAT